MKKSIILLCLLSACTIKPYFYGINKTDNFVRKIEVTDNFAIENQWPSVLKKQPIISGHRNITHSDLILVQTQCNHFKWAHKNDILSTPKEAQLKGWGDCKDATLCKYYKLRAIGATPDQLNIWQGWYGSGYEEHMTLAVRIKNKQYILDDMTNNLIEAKDYMHKDFEPYARFNEIGWDY